MPHYSNPPLQPFDASLTHQLISTRDQHPFSWVLNAGHGGPAEFSQSAQSTNSPIQVPEIGDLQIAHEPRNHPPNKGLGQQRDGTANLPSLRPTSLRDSVGAIPPASDTAEPNSSSRKAGPARSAPDGKRVRYGRLKASEVTKAAQPARLRRTKNVLGGADIIAARETQTGSSVVTEEQNPDGVITAVCLLWLEKNDYAMPSEHVISCLSHAFNDSQDLLRGWFLKNATGQQINLDSGYHTMTDPGANIAHKYRGNRRICNRNRDHNYNRQSQSMQNQRNQISSFACTSRCGATFSKKGAWTRHEERNRPQNVWYCAFRQCQTKSEGGSVFFRKDHFKSHLTSKQSNLHVTESMMATSCVSIKDNFSAQCIFKGCNVRFASWKERNKHIAGHFSTPWSFSDWREEGHEDDAVEDSDDDVDTSRSSDSDETRFSEGDDDDDPDGPGSPNHDHGSQQDTLSRSRQPSWNRHSRESQGPRGTHGSSRSRAYQCFSTFRVGGYFSDAPMNLDANARTSREPPYLSSSVSRTDHDAELRYFYSSRRSHRSVLIDIVGVLESGAKATVSKITMQGSQRVLACKRANQKSSQSLRDLFREATIISRLSHPYIVRPIALCDGVEGSMLFMLPVADYNLEQCLNTDCPTESYGKMEENLVWLSSIRSSACT